MTKDAARHAQMYGARHRRLRAQWKVKVDAGGVACWRCRQPVPPGSRWHLDHLPGGAPDQYVYPVPVSHPRCNELGVLPGTTSIVTQIAPAGPGRGRISADERVARSLPTTTAAGFTSPAGLTKYPGRGSIREMDGEGAPTEGPHMHGPHRCDGANLSQYWPGHCDCRPGEADWHAAYVLYLKEAHRVPSKLLAEGRSADAVQWLTDNPGPRP